MPVQWCVHPVYHSGKTKVGPKPSHPRGTRRVDDKLVKFINDTHGILLDSTAESIKEGDLLCRTCYEEESRRLNLHNISLTNMEEEYGQMNIDDNTAKRRCTRALIFTESSDKDFLFVRVVNHRSYKHQWKKVKNLMVWKRNSDKAKQKLC